MGNQIIQSIKTIAQSLVDKAGYDKTRGGFIVGVNSVTNTYSVKVDGVTYPIVRAVDDATYNIGDVVKVVIPCNQATQMYISSSVLSDDSTGNKIANAVGLAQEAKQLGLENQADISNAAKVATNFINYDSTNGLIIGNKTSDSWSGYRSQILPDSFNILDESSTVLASFGPTTVIGEEAKANMHLTFNNFSMADKDGTTLFKVGDNRNAEGIATLQWSSPDVPIGTSGSTTITVGNTILSIVSVYVDSVELSSSEYSFSGMDVTINGLTANSKKTIEITYTTTESTVYLTFGERDSSGNIGNYSVAEGYNVISSGYCSHAEGYRTTASGWASHAEGGNTTASEYRSHAEGYTTTASGWASHAEGYRTTASEYCSHAEGRRTTASGYCSHAEGFSTTASVDCSHAGGLGTVADGDYMTAIGKYNTRHSGKAFAIGNGTGDTARSDAFTVDWSGNATMKGGLTLGTALSIANGGTGAKTAAAARTNLGLVGVETRTLLWTNASPTSAFAAQTISLDLSGYDAVEIEYYGSTTKAASYVIKRKIGESSFLTGYLNPQSTSGYINLLSRSISVTTSGITFGSCVAKRTADSSTVATNNSYCIPYKIYGIKGV